MSFYNFFKDFFGFGSRPKRNFDNDKQSDFPPEENPISQWIEDDSDESRLQNPNFSFWSSSDPRDINRFFEQQFERIMNSFHMFNIPSIFGNFENFHGHIEGDDGSSAGNLRDQYLKPGYEFANEVSPESSASNDVMKDRDLDGELNINDVDKFCKKKSPFDIVPFANDFASIFLPSLKDGNVFSYNSSETTQQINGRFETQKRTFDTEGNEKVTVTRRIGDQSYSKTTNTDRNGIKTVEENFINLSKEELPDFEKKWRSGNSRL